MTDRRALFVNVRRSQIKRWSVTAAYREPTARWLLKTETASLLQRTITPRFSGAIAASLACHMRFKFWTQICLPTQLTLDKATGVRSAICIGVLGPVVI